VTDDERASRLPLAESKDASRDVEWVPSPNPLFKEAATPSPPDEEARTPIPFLEEAASPFATPPSSSSSSKPALLQTKINFAPITKPARDSLYTLGRSSDEEDYGVSDSEQQ
jgi:hypothetical protein